MRDLPLSCCDLFLTAARELREGVVPTGIVSGSPDTILAMPIDSCSTSSLPDQPSAATRTPT
jgi:hypothetical protein